MRKLCAIMCSHILFQFERRNEMYLPITKFAEQMGFTYAGIEKIIRRYNIQKHSVGGLACITLEDAKGFYFHGSTLVHESVIPRVSITISEQRDILFEVK